MLHRTPTIEFYHTCKSSREPAGSIHLPRTYKVRCLMPQIRPFGSWQEAKASEVLSQGETPGERGPRAREGFSGEGERKTDR